MGWDAPLPCHLAQVVEVEAEQLGHVGPVAALASYTPWARRLFDDGGGFGVIDPWAESQFWWFSVMWGWR